MRSELLENEALAGSFSAGVGLRVAQEHNNVKAKQRLKRRKFINLAKTFMQNPKAAKQETHWVAAFYKT
jgi:hypothetical protein